MTPARRAIFTTGYYLCSSCKPVRFVDADPESIVLPYPYLRIAWHVILHSAYPNNSKQDILAMRLTKDNRGGKDVLIGGHGRNIGEPFVSYHFR